MNAFVTMTETELANLHNCFATWHPIQREDTISDKATFFVGISSFCCRIIAIASKCSHYPSRVKRAQTSNTGELLVRLSEYLLHSQ